MARDAKLPTAFPQILRNYEGFPELDSARQQYTAQLSELIGRATEAASEQRLHADDRRQPAYQATTLMVTDNVISKASTRSQVGNPPGKPGSLGDAITWELMLQHHPHGEDLDIITGDRDYLSPLRDGHLNAFLETEWNAAKWSQAVRRSATGQPKDSHRVIASRDGHHLLRARDQNPIIGFNGSKAAPCASR